MKDDETNITVRVPIELVEKLRRLAGEESVATGLRIDLSSVVRRALVSDLAARAKKSKKGATE